MRAPRPDIEAALRRLLVGLERPAQLDEWRHRVLPVPVVVERLALPKAA